MGQPGEDGMDGNVLAIVVSATVSTSLFIVAVLVLLLLLYRRDPACCQFLCSCRFFQSRGQCDCPPPYFSSSQRLVGPQCRASRVEGAAGNHGVQADELFCVGPPSSYQLPSWEQPRLPSYDSVRKKDRQREIHQMIAERFGLRAQPAQELPPPYEHALRHPPAFSGTGVTSEALDREQPNLRPSLHFYQLREAGKSDPAGMDIHPAAQDKHGALCSDWGNQGHLLALPSAKLKAMVQLPYSVGGGKGEGLLHSSWRQLVCPCL
ncbi:uncharacterized protein LOC136048145 [Cyrtonyx montezumae]|uniref:uncharacterized protein LOC136048145 n=1 Tax=Cyrtonyx montezumae TaxID=9017 RepID=UPI0032DB2CA9